MYMYTYIYIYNHNALDGTWLMVKELCLSLFSGRLQIRPCIAEASENPLVALDAH